MEGNSVVLLTVEAERIVNNKGIPGKLPQGHTKSLVEETCKNALVITILAKCGVIAIFGTGFTLFQ